MVFTSLGYLVGGRHIDYPHVLGARWTFIVAFAGDAKQKIEVVKVKITDLMNCKEYYCDNPQLILALGLTTPPY